MKIKSALLILTLLAFIAGASAEVFAFSATYEQKVSVNGSEVATINVKAQDDFVRAESSFGNMTAVMIRNESGAYSYLPAQNMITKIPAELDRPNLTRDIPHFMDYLNKNQAKKTGAEKIGDYQTDIYEFTEPSTQKPAKAWVWAEKQFPVKIEVNAPEGLTTIEIQNIKLDQKLDAATFKLPENAKMLDLNALPNSGQAAPADESANAGAPGSEAKPELATPPAGQAAPADKTAAQ